jgi:hypothetical protein
MVCDGYGNIFACTGVKKVTTEEPETTPLVTLPPRIPEFPCSDKPDGFYPDPENACSNTYFVCSKKFDHKLSCPSGLYFDIESEICEQWIYVLACAGTKVERTTVMPLDIVTEKVPFECKGMGDGDYPDPTSKCSTIYYSCSGGVATKRECAGETYFDQEIDLCETFDNVPECSGTYRRLTTTFSPIEVEKHPFECQRKGDGNYPEGDCLEYYWSCVGGVTFKIDCPLELKYDTEMNLCDWSYHIPKCGGERPTRRPDDEMVTEGPKLALDCGKLADGAYPDPDEDCSKSFYVCVSGRTNKIDCPGALFYNIISTRCDLKFHVPACGGSMTEKPPKMSNYEARTEKPSGYKSRTTPELPVPSDEPKGYNAKPKIAKPKISKIKTDQDTPLRQKPSGYEALSTLEPTEILVFASVKPIIPKDEGSFSLRKKPSGYEAPSTVETPSGYEAPTTVELADEPITTVIPEVAEKEQGSDYSLRRFSHS